MPHPPQTTIAFETPSRTMEGTGVSVVVPLFNYETYVRDALESVFRQTHPNIELIIVDDCSTDTSPTAAQAWLREKGGRFSGTKLLCHTRNCGAAQTRNTGFTNAANEFVFVLDADNEIYPEAISKLLAASLSAGTEAAYSQLESFGLVSIVGKAAAWDPEVLARGNYIDAMALIRKRAWEAVGGYSDFETPGWDDYDLWCKFVEHGFKGTFVPEILCRYRVHAASLSNRSANPNYGRLATAMSKRHPWLRLGASRFPRVTYTLHGSKKLVFENSSREFFFRQNPNDIKLVNRVFGDGVLEFLTPRKFPQLAEYARQQQHGDNRPLIVDVGANIGASSVYLCNAFPDAFTVAIEPDHQNAQLLSKNITGLNVEAVHGAVASKPGWAVVVDPDMEDWDYATKFIDTGVKLPNSVPQVTINQLYEAHQARSFPFIVKIDIRGAEEDLLSNNVEWVDQTPLIAFKSYSRTLVEGITAQSPVMDYLLRFDRDLHSAGEFSYSIAKTVGR